MYYFVQTYNTFSLADWFILVHPGLTLHFFPFVPNDVCLPLFFVLFSRAEYVCTMVENDITFNRLRMLVEKVAGRRIVTPRDFDYLSMRILDSTRMYVSAMTLKRFWGYLGDRYQTSPSRYTLNALAQYAGYINWESFCTTGDKSTEHSNFLPNDCIRSSSLKRNDRIELMWYPDRRVIINYEGLGMFKVAESINSKLSSGDTFMCDCIIDGEPLHLYCLVHEGNAPTNFVCGNVGGIKFKIIDN